MIAPVKEEQLNEDPPIWLYHDVITEKQITVMKQLALPRVLNFFNLFLTLFISQIYLNLSYEEQLLKIFKQEVLRLQITG